ncbi:MAG TPA: hypothetical protein VFQ88_15820 [Nevskiaceae bacterium]|nr:hypothetical protein [Nevskiaceae bacterium]
MKASRAAALEASERVVTPAAYAGPRLAWHAALWQQVDRAAAAQRLSHALLLAGPAGVGKRVFAEQLARALLCEGREAATAPLRACGHCAACRQMETGAHSGYRCLSLATTGAAQRIPVDAVRDASAALALTSAGARAKVLVIDRSDDLNASSFNALLKTLEEPAADSYILLISELLLEVPATLRSRCQILRFAAPSRRAALAYMEQALPQAPESDCAQALDENLGAPLAALACLGDSQRSSERRAWRTQLETLFGGHADPFGIPLPSQRDAALADLRVLKVQLWRRARQLLEGGESALPGVLRMDREATRGLEQLAANVPPDLAMQSVLIACAGVVAARDRGHAPR